MRATHTGTASASFAGPRKALPSSVVGTNDSAQFILKAHRGEGMLLLAMDWRGKQPPKDFVGFAIEYREPKSKIFHPVSNRLGFLGKNGKIAGTLSSLLSPIQKFRWVHFPMKPDLVGEFTYRVTPVFMDAKDQLTYGESQQIKMALAAETYPGKLNVTFTRGFICSQAFVDRFGKDGSPSTIIPASNRDQLKFKPAHPKADEALAWMGFETRQTMLSLLDEAIDDKTCEVSAIAYDFQDPEIIDRFKKLGKRLRIVIDDSDKHGEPDSPESRSARSLATILGKSRVLRQHMSCLQHNKIVIVSGKKIQKVLCGSTNMSWRGLYVQNNNAVVLQGKEPVSLFMEAFESYWTNPSEFRGSNSATWCRLGIPGIDAQATFSPHSSTNAAMEGVADDMLNGATSSVLYSLAFLSNSPGVIQKTIKQIVKEEKLFLYGISEDPVKGLELQKPTNERVTASPKQLGKNAPEPFKPEPVGGSGIRMHHKFVVIDFNKPGARVYFGSHNFSNRADGDNGENLVLVRDARVATAFAVEALRIFDHYSFRDRQADSSSNNPLTLKKPPRSPGQQPWWYRDYNDPVKVRDRKLFSS